MSVPTAKFWMIICDDGKPVTYTNSLWNNRPYAFGGNFWGSGSNSGVCAWFESKEEAEDEALKLGRKYLATFWVMEAISCSNVPIQITRL